MAQVMKSIASLCARHSISASASPPTLCRISNRFYAQDAEEPSSHQPRKYVSQSSNFHVPMVNTLSRRGFAADVCKTKHDIHSRSFYSHASASSANSSNRVFAPYTVFKGKAALSVSPVLPTFKKLDSGDLQVDRKGVIMLRMWPAIGERQYDWEKRQAFALSATEVGSLISLGPKDSVEFFHDPSMKSSEAGQVRKSLSIKANADGSGYFISLTVANNITKTNDRLTIPVTMAELAVIRSASSFALPHIMGWGRCTNQFPAGSTYSAKAPHQVKDSEWDR